MATCSPSKLSTFSRMVQCISFLFLCLNTIKPIYARQNRNTPHDHRGKLTPYAPGPFLNLSLDNGDEKTLSGGNAVMKVLADEDEPSGGGKSICVQDVEAPKEAVWNQILDLDHYVGKVSKLKECSNYLVKTRPDGTFQVKTKMVVGVMPGYKVRNATFILKYHSLSIAHFHSNLLDQRIFLLPLKNPYSWLCVLFDNCCIIL